MRHKKQAKTSPKAPATSNKSVSDAPPMSPPIVPGRVDETDNDWEVVRSGAGKPSEKSSDKINDDKTGSDKTKSDKPNSDKPNSDKPNSDKPNNDKPNNDNTDNDKTKNISFAWGPANVKVNPRLANAKEIAKSWATENQNAEPGVTWGEDNWPTRNYDEFMAEWNDAVEVAQNAVPDTKQKPKRRKWPTNREMKARPLPDGPIEFFAKWDDEPESEKDDDPYREVRRLAGWDGNFQPPPADWDNRYQRPSSTEETGRKVWQWMLHKEEPARVDLTNLMIRPEFKSGENIAHELAPREWVPAPIDWEFPTYAEFCVKWPLRAPLPLDPEDLNPKRFRPYWQLYSDDKTNSFLPPPVAPEAPLDLKDFNNRQPRSSISANEMVIRCSKHHLDKLEKEKTSRRKHQQPIFSDGEERRAAQHVQKMIKERKEAPLKAPEDSPSGAKAIELKANIYIRPVKPEDIFSITEMYNHFVKNTISACEFEARRDNQIANRVNTIISENLPFLVAVAKNDKKPKGPRKHMKEVIVGYASLDEWCDKSTMWRHSVELEMFVHPEWTRKGVASCLLDQILFMVSDDYVFRGGYEYQNRGDYLQNGSMPVVKSIIVQVPYDARISPTWIKSFFGSFGFRKAGHLHEFGFKNGTVVDVVLFQYRTKEAIDPNSRPNVST
jgi:L-amino acid N-acyltransferase YncA